VSIWDLLDIVSILSDDELCDPALGFWLVEELLDSQTIAGCRKVFDYLESRRERMTAKHFKQKELVILRSCKELLRRLSRAEDTAFCGRVYVFMFQSFPLGDKSSVNLRGEYHIENVTTFDELPPKTEGAGDQMDVDNETKATSSAPTTESKTTPSGPSSLTKPNEEAKNVSKSVSFDSKGPSQGQKPLDPDTLYPIFWSLQQDFSQPKRLFEQENLTTFKQGLEATMIMFKSVQNEQTGRGPTKSLEECKRGTKRKRGQRGDDLASTFNPKYLTSRDLFELEVGFLDHILPSRVANVGRKDQRSVIPKTHSRPSLNHNGLYLVSQCKSKGETCHCQDAKQIGHVPGANPERRGCK
jgi:THO complex subunit 1